LARVAGAVVLIALFIARLRRPSGIAPGTRGPLRAKAASLLRLAVGFVVRYAMLRVQSAIRQGWAAQNPGNGAGPTVLPRYADV
jgi:hypothetical protein